MGTQDGLIVPGYMEHALKENTVPTRNLQMYAKVLSKVHVSALPLTAKRL